MIVLALAPNLLLAAAFLAAVVQLNRRNRK